MSARHPEWGFVECRRAGVDGYKEPEALGFQVAETLEFSGRLLRLSHESHSIGEAGQLPDHRR
jgi:hypothetical protein